MSDTTERGRAGNAWHLAEIVASFGDAVIGQTFDGIVTCWNGAAERMLGWSTAAILDQSIARVLPVASRDAERDALARIRAGALVEHVETERLRRDGTTIPVFATFSPILRDGGEVAGVSVILRDLSGHAAAAEAQPAAPVRDHDGANRGGATVLLVEDDVDLLDVLREILSAEGLNVIAATDGLSALGLLALHPEVAALVSDIVMPNGVSGLLLAREAQRLHPDLPVLLMSGRPPEEINRLGSTWGFPLLVKPFRPEELTSQMRRLLH
jgi:PAS domain S-box-containing protein